jgi:hypothetical protein
MALSKHFIRSNLAQKNLNYMHKLISAILAIFQRGLAVSAALKNKCIIAFERFFLFWVQMNI